MYNVFFTIGVFFLLQMSFLAKTSNIMERTLYPSTYMTNYIEDDLNPARIAMINHFKWNKVATLFYKEAIFVSVSCLNCFQCKELCLHTI